MQNEGDCKAAQQSANSVYQITKKPGIFQAGLFDSQLGTVFVNNYTSVSLRNRPATGNYRGHINYVLYSHLPFLLQLHVEVLNFKRICFDKFSAWLNLVSH